MKALAEMSDQELQATGKEAQTALCYSYMEANKNNPQKLLEFADQIEQARKEAIERLHIEIVAPVSQKESK
jgi:hypothetical protein